MDNNTEDNFTMVDTSKQFTCLDCLNANEHECLKCGELAVYCDYWGEFVKNPQRVMTEEDCEGAVV